MDLLTASPEEMREAMADLQYSVYAHNRRLEPKRSLAAYESLWSPEQIARWEKRFQEERA